MSESEKTQQNHEHVFYFVYWDNIDRKSYLYGADLTIRPDKSVHFGNEMMPAGSVIQEWDSVETDTVIRKEPELPLMVEGKRYHLHVYAYSDRTHSVIMRLNFFDRQHHLISYVMVDEAEMDVTCPGGTFRYSLQLINAGMGEFDFRCIVISTGEENEDSICGRLLNRDPQGVVLSVVVPPYLRRMVRIPEPDQLMGIRNCVIAPVTVLMPEPFYDRDWLRQVPLPENGEIWRSVNFISYHRETDAYVRRLAELYHGGFPVCVKNKAELGRLSLG